MYTTYFGFKQIPFDPKLNPSEFYDGLSARINELALIEAIENHCRVMFLWGDPGVGKTALLRKLASDLSRTRQFLFPAREGSRIDPIMDCLFEGLGVDLRVRAPRQKLEILRKRLANSEEPASNRVLVIDDAHELPTATIEDLLGLVQDQAGDVPAIQLLLAGSPALKSRANESWSKHSDVSAICWCHLEGLTGEEVRSFIHQRLELAGYHGEPLFSDRAISRIIDYSEGSIAKVGVLCGFSLLNASLENLKVVTEEIVEEEAVHCLLNIDRVTDDRTVPAGREGATLPSPGGFRDQLIGDGVTARYEELGIPRPDTGTRNETGLETLRVTRPEAPPRGWMTRFSCLARYGTIVLSAMLLVLIIVGDGYSFYTTPIAGIPESNPIRFETSPASDRESAQRDTALLPPDQNENPGNSADVKIQAMLFKAQDQVADQRLFTPAGDNALDTYKEIASLVERQLQTLNDMVQIKQLYQRWGLEAEIQGDWLSAEKFYQKAFKLSPHDKELTAAIERVRNHQVGTDSSNVETRVHELTEPEIEAHSRRS
ncbi:MAG: AAA family ATPase [Methylococcales bacterium]